MISSTTTLLSFPLVSDNIHGPAIIAILVPLNRLANVVHAITPAEWGEAAHAALSRYEIALTGGMIED